MCTKICTASLSECTHLRLYNKKLYIIFYIYFYKLRLFFHLPGTATWRFIFMAISLSSLLSGLSNFEHFVSHASINPLMALISRKTDNLESLFLGWLLVDGTVGAAGGVTADTAGGGWTNKKIKHYSIYVRKFKPCCFCSASSFAFASASATALAWALAASLSLSAFFAASNSLARASLDALSCAAFSCNAFFSSSLHKCWKCVRYSDIFLDDSIFRFFFPNLSLTTFKFYLHSLLLSFVSFISLCDLLMFILIAEVLDTFINSLFIQLVKLCCAIKLSAQ